MKHFSGKKQMYTTKSYQYYFLIPITSLVMDIFNINPHLLTQMSNVRTLYHTYQL